MMAIDLSVILFTHEFLYQSNMPRNRLSKFKNYTVDGIRYKIIDEGSRKEQVATAKRLHQMNRFAIGVMKFMRDYIDYHENEDEGSKFQPCSRPRPEVDIERLKVAWNRLRKNYNIDKIHEVPHGGGKESYVRNLGEEVHFCFRGDCEIVALAVLVHELSHIISYNSIHDEAFWNNFRFMCKIVRLGGFIPYHKVPKAGGYHCGKVLVPHSEISLMACRNKRNALGERLIGTNGISTSSPPLNSGYQVHKQTPNELQFKYLRPGGPVYSIPTRSQMHYNSTQHNYRMGYGRMAPSSPFSTSSSFYPYSMSTKSTRGLSSSYNPHENRTVGGIARGKLLPSKRQRDLVIGPADLLQPTIKEGGIILGTGVDMSRYDRYLTSHSTDGPPSNTTARTGPPLMRRPVETKILRSLAPTYKVNPRALYSPDMERIKILSLHPPYSSRRRPMYGDTSVLVTSTFQPMYMRTPHPVSGGFKKGLYTRAPYIQAEGEVEEAMSIGLGTYQPPRSHSRKPTDGGYKSLVRNGLAVGYRSDPFLPPDVRRLYDPNI